MTHYKIEPVIKYNHKVFDKETCDRCGKEITTPGLYNVFNCTFEYEKGQRFPDGGHGDIKNLDICSECSDIAISVLEENGFKFVNTNIE